MPVVASKFFLCVSNPYERSGTNDYVSLAQWHLRESVGGANASTGGTSGAADVWPSSSVSNLFDSNTASFWRMNDLRVSGSAYYDFGSPTTKSIAETALRVITDTSINSGYPMWQKEAPRTILITAKDPASGDHIPCVYEHDVSWTAASEQKVYSVTPVGSNRLYRLRCTKLPPGVTDFVLGKVTLSETAGGDTLYDPALVGVASPLRCYTTGLYDVLSTVDGVSTRYFKAGITSNPSYTENNVSANYWVAYGFNNPVTLEEISIKVPATDYNSFPDIIKVEVWFNGAWLEVGSLNTTGNKVAGATHTIALTPIVPVRTMHMSDAYSQLAKDPVSLAVSFSYRADSPLLSTIAISCTNRIDAKAIVTQASSYQYTLNAAAAESAHLSANYKIIAPRAANLLRTLMSSEYALNIAEIQTTYVGSLSKLNAYGLNHAAVQVSCALFALSATTSAVSSAYQCNAFTATRRNRAFTATYACNVYAPSTYRFSAEHAVSAFAQAGQYGTFSWGVGAFVPASVRERFEYAVEGWTGATTWVVNTINAAVSKYQSFEFTAYAQVGDVLYGMATDGIYALTEDQVSATIRTGRLDFREQTPNPAEDPQNTRKRMRGVYVSGRRTSGLTVTASVDDSPEYTYQTAGSDSRTGTSRIVVGKGLAGRLWKFSISGVMDLDTADIEYLPATNKRMV